MATSAGLVDSEVHKVQEVWTGQKDLWVAHFMAKGSPKGHPVFLGGASHWIAQDHGTKGDLFPQKLSVSKQHWSSVCGAEKKGTIINHLQTSHYHLGLVCSECLRYFTTSADTMHCHSQLSKWTLAGIDDDNDQEEESQLWQWWGWLHIYLGLPLTHQALPYPIVHAKMNCLCTWSFNPGSTHSGRQLPPMP